MRVVTVVRGRVGDDASSGPRQDQVVLVSKVLLYVVTVSLGVLNHGDDFRRPSQSERLVYLKNSLTC